jgi:hypothetical protein
MIRANIVGVEHFVPDKVLSNKDLEKLVETNDEWIVERTGIKERRIVEKGTGVSDIMYPAVMKLLESTYRVEKCLKEILEFLGNRYVVVARELTKLYEEFVSGSVEDIINNIENLKIKGEFVVLIADENFKKK